MKRAAKKATKSRVRKSAPRKTAKDADMRETRQKVRNVVAGQAVPIVQAVTEEVKKQAQVQAMKALFEMIGLFGKDAAPDAPPEDDQALAKVLLDRFNLPDFPVTAEEESAPLQAPAEVTGDSVK